LKGLGIESLYHKFTGEQQGKETDPTLYFQKKIERPYHIDYLFGTQKFSNLLTNIEIGKAEKMVKNKGPYANFL
jgi:hypothetical protein